MAANSEHAASTATNLNNPFLTKDEKTYVSSVPAPTGAGAGGLADPLIADSSRIAGTGNDQTISSAGLGSGSSSSATTQGLTNPLDKTHTVTGEHAQHAGALAPSESTVAPAHVPEGTGHVTNILTGIAGAVLSAPAAALEAISPKAAGKTSDGVALISSKMPAVSLEDVTNTTRNVAASAYNAVPEGTGATVQAYTGAAVAKAQEVLPPALGGSAAKGNTGEGDLAKSPTQLASEYGNATSAAISNAAASATAYISQTLGIAKQTAVDTANTASQKASDAATVASQKASEAANVTSQKASEASTAASQTASDLSNRASATASDYTQSAKQTANQAAESTRQTAADYSESARQTANQAAESTRQTAADYSASAQQTANQAADSTRQTASNYSSSTTTSGGQDPYLYGAMPSGTSGTHVTNVRSEPAFSTTSSSEPATLHAAHVSSATTATQSHTGQPGTYEYTEDQLKNSRTAL